MTRPGTPTTGICHCDGSSSSDSSHSTLCDENSLVNDGVLSLSDDCALEVLVCASMGLGYCAGCQQHGKSE